MPITNERLADIEAIPDEDIDTSDIPEAHADFFERAIRSTRRPKPGQREVSEGDR